MPFIILTFAAALAIEVIGSYISIVGLAMVFAANAVIMIMAGVLDFSKIIVVSFLYKKWSGMNKLMRAYMLVAALVLMTITSAGAFGYLSSEFQNAVLPNKENAIKLQSLSEEQARLQTRKIEIDKQIAQIPPNIVKNRIKLINTFKEETQRINDRLTVIDVELPKLKIENATKNAHIGPISYVAEAFDVSMEQAVKYVILLIIFVFDPLAISLIIAGNYLLEERRNQQTPTTRRIKALTFDEEQKEDADDVKKDHTLSIMTDEEADVLKILSRRKAVKEDQESEEEPVSSVRTTKQLNKLYNESINADNAEIIPLSLLDENKVFTEEKKNDIIHHMPLKGIMAEANSSYSGSGVAFETSHSNSIGKYNQK